LDGGSAPSSRAVLRGPPIELVAEDRFDGAIGLGADLDGALGGRFDSRSAVGAEETDDAETGAITLLGMRPRLQDLLARAAVAGPIFRAAGVAAMAGRHVLGNGCVLAVGAGAQGDAFAFVEDLDAARSQSRLDLGAGEALGAE
jgi:hypothetical protein